MIKKHKRFETDKVDILLAQYKSQPSYDNLNLLYNELENIITQVTEKIASSFRYKHPDDFEDIQQNVRISIYKILERLANISISGNQVVSIVVQATVWSFKTHYRRYKKHTPIKLESEGSIHLHYESQSKIIEIPIDRLSILDSEAQGPFTEGRHSWCGELHKELHLNSGQFAGTYLHDLPRLIMEEAVRNNRYPDKEDLVRFCLMSIVEGRSPSMSLIGKKWEESEPSYWPRYSLILLRVAMLHVIS